MSDQFCHKFICPIIYRYKKVIPDKIWIFKCLYSALTFFPARRFHGRVRLGFGIGTNLMNDRGPAPLNVVIKMVKANGQPVAKISDAPEKGMCEDEGYLAYLRQVFGIA